MNMNNNTKTRITAFIISLLILATVGLCSFSTVSYADTTLNFDGIKDAQYSNWENLPDDFKEVGQAYYNFFKSKGSLNMIKNASEIPISWFKVLKDGTPVISPLGQLFYYLDGGELFVEDKSENGYNHHTSGGRHRAGNTEPVIPSETFVNTVNNNTTALTTSLPTNTVSWKHNPLSVSQYDKLRTDQHFTLMSGGKWFGTSKDVYAMPFVVKDGITYYGDSVYRFYYGDFTDSDDVLYPNYPIVDKFSSLSSTNDVIDSYIFSGSTSVSFDDCYAVPYSLDYGLERFLLGDKQFYLTGLNVRTNVTSFYFCDNQSYSHSLLNSFYNSSDIADTQELYQLIPITDSSGTSSIGERLSCYATNPYCVKTSDTNSQ